MEPNGTHPPDRERLPKLNRSTLDWSTLGRIEEIRRRHIDCDVDQRGPFCRECLTKDGQLKSDASFDATASPISTVEIYLPPIAISAVRAPASSASETARSTRSASFGMLSEKRYSGSSRSDFPGPCLQYRERCHAPARRGLRAVRRRERSRARPRAAFPRK